MITTDEPEEEIPEEHATPQLLLEANAPQLLLEANATPRASPSMTDPGESLSMTNPKEEETPMVPTAKEFPVRFFSQSLSAVQQRWAIPEKEMYSIVRSVQKFEPLLRNRFFTIHTDHHNLTNDVSTGSPKVLRWKLYLQEFDFELVRIKGEDIYNPRPDNVSGNYIADGLSRLCAITDVEEHEWCCSIGRFASTEGHVNSESESPPAGGLDIHSPSGLGRVDSDTTIAAIDNISLQIPRETYTLIGKAHNSLVGHHGVARTLMKLQAQGSKFPHMRETVRNFIMRCPCCQKMSQLRTPIHTTPFTVASYDPFRHIAMDSIGPLPITTNGNVHVLALICKHTRAVELYATKSTSGEDTVIPLIGFVSRYGCPRTLTSDNGPQFVNDACAELYKVLGTEHSRTLAYSKEENAISERINKEIMRHVRAFIFDIISHDDWDKYLPLVQRILWTQVHSSTGVSPAALVYGNSVNLDEGILVDHHEIDDTSPTSLSAATSTMLAVQERLFQTAAKLQRVKDNEHMSSEPTGKMQEFPVNSFVLMSYPEGRMGALPPTKLHLNLKGPLRVVKVVGAHYDVQNLTTGSIDTVHQKRLKPFLYDATVTDPATIARRDQIEFVVEEVVQHIGSPKRKSEMDFLVKWLNYEATENSWVPWRELRNNTELHKYLNENGMQKLVPREHR